MNEGLLVDGVGIKRLLPFVPVLAFRLMARDSKPQEAAAEHLAQYGGTR